MHKIQVSIKCMLHTFPCYMEYIENICHGACCKSKTHGAATIIVSPSEKATRAYLQSSSNFPMQTLENNQIVTYQRMCVCQNDNGTCVLHSMGLKPLGCTASPFMLTKHDVLITQRRYLALKCHRNPGDYKTLPAYIAFKSSLVRLFGNEQYQELCMVIEKCELERLPLNMENNVYDALKYIQRERLARVRRNEQ